MALQVVLVLTVVALIAGYWRETRLGRARTELVARQIADTWNSVFQRTTTRRIGASIDPVLTRAFGAPAATAATWLAEMSTGRHTLSPGCACSRVRPRYTFRAEPVSGAMVIAGDTAGIPARARVAQVARGRLGSRSDSLSDFAERGRDAIGPWIMYFRVFRTPDNDPVVIGMEYPVEALDTAFLRPAYEAVLAERWPDPLTRDVAVRIEAWLYDSLVFRAGPDFESPYVADGPYADGFALLRAALWLNPSVLSRLTPSGAPGLPSSAFVGMLLLGVLMGTASVLLLVRTTQLARARSDFASSVSHELRTPLTQILLAAETLQLDRPAARTREEGARIIVRETRRLIRLVENILQFSAAQRGAPALDRSFRFLAPLVDEAVAGFADIAAGRQATLRTSLDSEAAAVVDADAVRSIVTNLVDNALRYGPAGQTVHVGLARDDGRAVLTVRDEGPGVPAGQADAIWEAFERGGRQEPGTGIGLANVRILVELQGGRCRIGNADGGGAEAVVELPLAEPTAT